LVEKKLDSKKNILTPQNLTRYRAVLHFMRFQQGKIINQSRKQLAYSTAIGFWKGWYFTKKLITWELLLLRGIDIPEGKQGCFAKSKSWFNDEKVMLYIRE
jgi:hypothetical protein